jgi:hypothetical protein
MEFESQIKDFIEDKGKDKDGRLIVSVPKLPNGNIIKFLEWFGKEFIKKGGLYAVDIICPKGTYRVNRDKKEKNIWI